MSKQYIYKEHSISWIALDYLMMREYIIVYSMTMNPIYITDRKLILIRCANAVLQNGRRQ